MSDKPYILVNNECLHCGESGITDGYQVYDPCIGKLDEVMNACCGHGQVKSAYVQFSPDRRIAGQAALDYIAIHRRQRAKAQSE